MGHHALRHLCEVKIVWAAGKWYSYCLCGEWAGDAQPNIHAALTQWYTHSLS